MEAFSNSPLNFSAYLQDSGLWKVDVKIERIDGLPLTSGKCQNATNAQDPDYGNFSAILPTPRRYVLMLPSVCMEKDVAYVVKVTYSRDDSNKDGVESILTDAVRYLERKKKCSMKMLVTSCSRDLPFKQCVETLMRDNPNAS